MNLTRFSIQRPVGICMIVGLFVVLGLYSFYRIGVELLPALNTPYVTIYVKYPGASAESVEQQVVKPLEDALSSVSNVKQMTATASAEQARITLQLEFSANADYASIEATKKVNAARYKLPDDVDEPVVIKRDINAMPIMRIAVVSKNSLSDMYSKATNFFQDRLQQSDGVSEIELRGGRDREIAVEIDKDKLAFYELTLNQVIQKINSENTLLPSGSIYTTTTQTNVRITAQYKSVEEIEKLQITNSAGIHVPITAIANIKAQEARANRYGRVNGQDAVSMVIYKNSDANIVSTAEAVTSNLERLKKDYPEYEFIVVNNAADYVNKSLHNTLGTLIEGLCTTGLVLFLFLRGWRSTLAVMIAIPTSLISTFLVMYIAGFTFNMMSLMGMALCVGILVDDSIVVLENIHRHMMMGKEAKIAAEEGRNEIGMAAIAITLCDVVVFLPIAFMNGMTGQFFRQFGLTIVFATLFSLFISFTLTPMLASRLFAQGIKSEKRKIWTFMDRIENRAVTEYEKILKWSLHHRKKIVVSVLLLFIATMSFIPSGIVGSEYMPRTDESSFDINLQLPVGQSVEQTDIVISQMESYLETIPEVKYYLSYIGGTNQYEGGISVQLYDRKERSRSVWQITNDVRQFADVNISGGSVQVKETQSSVAGVAGGPGSGRGSGALQIELRANDLNSLVAASYKVQDLLKQNVKGIKDVSSSYTEGMPELQLEIDREKLKQYKTSIQDVTNTFSSAIAGKQAGVIANDVNNDGNDTDIQVRFRGSDGFKASDIAKIPLQADGRVIFIDDVASIKEGVGPVSIRRADKQRSIIIGANLTDRPLNEVIKESREVLKNVDLGKGVTYRFTGQANSMNDTFGELLQALSLALVLIYMLLAVLYESTLTPFIRMFSLPLGMIGSILLLFLTNNTINLYSLVGILVMDGLVAKNGTLLLDYTLTLMDRGMNAYDAIIEAGKVRLKPIFMTTLTMVVGMLPTALSLTEGSETRVSMAWVIIGGLLTSTVFTLVVIPIIFLFFEKHPMRSWWSSLKKCVSKA
ncbi:efflux RND transporter permease subunit [Anaerosinus massiliensis]|uniref:efflux RND transporter permease subunit n=1 Tax=Massilibacillus massiliensis TaxID=1806837 RepID=UPI000B231F3F|nr:efflux RND transporter permease subunit [Massilibacillus massiliensis]